MWERNLARFEALLRDDVLFGGENEPDWLGVFRRGI